MIFDTHAHLNDLRFKDDVDEIVSSFNDNGISYCLNAGCDIESSNASIMLSDKYESIYASVGFHPHSADEVTDDMLLEIEMMAQHPKCVAIGEMGLDYHYDNFDKAKQKNVFIKQMELAEKLKKPVIIHDRDSHEDCLEITALFKNVFGVYHCFSGDLDMATRLIELGYYISFAGPITFKKPGDLIDVAKNIPLDRIFIETDSPYLSPEPMRGKRNTPINVRHIAQKIADIRNVSVDTIIDATRENAKRLFNII